MTKDEVLKLAKECGFEKYGNEVTVEGYICTDELIAFANAIEQKAIDIACAEILAGMRHIKDQSMCANKE